MQTAGRDLNTRREFLQGAVASVALAAITCGKAIGTETLTLARPFLREYGFWDYTTPQVGGCEAFDGDDYALLLDDMAQAGMNSLVLVVKWFTTGYRSKLPYLDQIPGNKVIGSDNTLLRRVIREARARRIKIWLGAVTNFFDVDRFGSTPHTVTPNLETCPFKVGIYDPDAPLVVERNVEIFQEILEEFPGVDGLMLEMEDVAGRSPHRIPFYNQWAKENHRPLYSDPKFAKHPHWFDYQTASIIKVVRAVETAVRARGFRGSLATINKVVQREKPHPQLVNIEMMHRDCPAWATINYFYGKGQPAGNYDWYMKAGVTHPKSLGMNVYYLSRGVMTYGKWQDRQKLERSWTQDVADVCKFQPQNLWWFNAGTKNDGVHTSLSALKRMGYADDVAARRALLKTTSFLRSAMV